MKRVLIGGCVALALAIAWLAWRTGAGEHHAAGASPSSPLTTDQPTPAPLPLGAHPLDTDTATPERKEIEAVHAGPAIGTVTLRGRCVDGNTGAPIAGCVVDVHGWGRNTEEVDAYLKDNDGMEWEDPPDQTTGTNGCFSFTFVPPPPYQFTLGIRSPGFVWLTGRWTSLAPGTVKDFGDIAMERGSEVSGHVADSNEAAQGGVGITIAQHDPGGTELRARRHYGTRSRGDGTFFFDSPVPFGTWSLTLRGRQKIAPDRLEIPDGQRFTSLAIKTRPLEEIEAISGIVVDENGTALRDVRIEATSALGSGSSTISGRDGRFRIERRQGDPDSPLSFHLDRSGFEDFVSETSYPWGTEDLRLVMQRGLGVEIVVTDGATQEPIEDYTVRCFPAPGSRNHWRSSDFESRGRGHHPGGRLRIEGITLGAQLLLVEPKGDVWARSDFIRFEVTDRGAPEQRVELFRPVTRMLRVRYPGGGPAAGTEVELLREFGSEPTTITTPAVPFHRLSRYSGNCAALLMKGRTDSRGELLLRGSPGGTLVLRILGPGHEPVLEPQVRLAANAPPLAVTVSAGATVAGRLGPPGIFERLLPSAATRSGDDALQRRKIYQPGLLFVRSKDGQRSTYPAKGFADRLRLEEDGTFEAKGVPIGTWDLHVAYWRESSSAHSFVQTVADLAEGEVRKIEADLGHLIPGRVTGVVEVNGVPLENGSAQLIGQAPDGQGGETPVHYYGIELDAAGAFSLQTTPGTYRLMVHLPGGKSGSNAHLPAAEQIIVRPGKDVHTIFHLQTGRLRIRLHDGPGKPVMGIVVNIADPHAIWSTRTTPTDEHGKTALDAALPGALVFTVAPKRLTDPEGLGQFLGANKANPNAWKEAMIPLGRARVTAGETPTEVELVLPASAGY